AVLPSPEASGRAQRAAGLILRDGEAKPAMRWPRNMEEFARELRIPRHSSGLCCLAAFASAQCWLRPQRIAEKNRRDQLSPGIPAARGSPGVRREMYRLQSQLRPWQGTKAWQIPGECRSDARREAGQPVCMPAVRFALATPPASR